MAIATALHGFNDLAGTIDCFWRPPWWGFVKILRNSSSCGDIQVVHIEKIADANEADLFLWNQTIFTIICGCLGPVRSHVADVNHFGAKLGLTIKAARARKS